MYIEGYLYLKCHTDDRGRDHWKCTRHCKEIDVEKCVARAMTRASRKGKHIVLRGPEKSKHNHQPASEELDEAMNLAKKKWDPESRRIDGPTLNQVIDNLQQSDTQSKTPSNSEQKQSSPQPLTNQDEILHQSVRDKSIIQQPTTRSKPLSALGQERSTLQLTINPNKVRDLSGHAIPILRRHIIQGKLIPNFSEKKVKKVKTLQQSSIQVVPLSQIDQMTAIAHHPKIQIKLLSNSSGTLKLLVQRFVPKNQPHSILTQDTKTQKSIDEVESNQSSQMIVSTPQQPENQDITKAQQFVVDNKFSQSCQLNVGTPQQTENQDNELSSSPERVDSSAYTKDKFGLGPSLVKASAQPADQDESASAQPWVFGQLIGKRLFVNGHVYMSYHKEQGRTYWECTRCRNRPEFEKCNARAVTIRSSNGDPIIVRGPNESKHNHPPVQSEINEAISLASEMRDQKRHQKFERPLADHKERVSDNESLPKSNHVDSIVHQPDPQQTIFSGPKEVVTILEPTIKDNPLSEPLYESNKKTSDLQPSMIHDKPSSNQVKNALQQSKGDRDKVSEKNKFEEFVMNPDKYRQFLSKFSENSVLDRNHIMEALRSIYKTERSRMYAYAIILENRETFARDHEAFQKNPNIELHALGEPQNPDEMTSEAVLEKATSDVTNIQDEGTKISDKTTSETQETVNSGLKTSKAGETTQKDAGGSNMIIPPMSAAIPIQEYLASITSSMNSVIDLSGNEMELQKEIELIDITGDIDTEFEDYSKQGLCDGGMVYESIEE
ncbi:hypothetical protein QAD02_006703 [Eretmocerus hayati]|uniref:Uncharacterized protein n=1 Tax=Eretmocerus hayati TaxID=131215 RepID=A0ACC2N2E7_9HYME|nr:hypothetical protein QAD02_006703 [Eretmocerus hayati]